MRQGTWGTCPHATWLTSLAHLSLSYYAPTHTHTQVAGFYDYGPPGCAIKQNVTQVGVRWPKELRSYAGQTHTPSESPPGVVNIVVAASALQHEQSTGMICSPCWLLECPLQAWRNHFVLEENMLEVECPAVTPEIVLKASGHVDRWAGGCQERCRCSGKQGGQSAHNAAATGCKGGVHRLKQGGLVT
jgi:hypothetical protein